MPGVSLSDRTLFRKLQNIQRTPGPAGAAGSDGAPGADGSVVTSGTAVPDNGDGNDGDIYLQTNATEDIVLVCYQKAAGSWTSIGDINAPWTAFTPVVSCQTGTITTATATMRYKKIGTLVVFRGQVSISNFGTGSGHLRLTTPVAPASGGHAGTGITDSFLSVSILSVTVGYTGLYLYRYDGVSPFNPDNLILFSGTYESA